MVTSSTPDRPEERAENVLSISRCKTLMYVLRNSGIRAQLYCGCAQNNPCYFSSRGNPDRNTNEFIVFRVHELTVMVGFTITPYQAHFQDGAPSFAPCFVQCDVFVPKIGRMQTNRNREPLKECDLLWSSTSYPVSNEFKTQAFYFPKPMVINQSFFVRVNLIGKQQRQPIVDMNDY